jgi:predicted secreted Zn-dependent protease
VKYYLVAHSRRIWLPMASLVGSLACAGAYACAPAPPPVTGTVPEPAPAANDEGRAVLSLARSVPEIPAGVFITNDTTLYPVVGPPSDVGALQSGVGRQSASDSDYIGLTGTQVQWEFRPIQADSGCRLVQVAVNLRIVTSLPQWLPPPGTPDSLRQEWKRFLWATLIHERGHRNIALHTAVAILHTLEGVHEAACPGIKEIANLHAQAAWDLGQRRQVDYDIVTAHGVTQGSRWPPPMTIGPPPEP